MREIQNKIYEKNTKIYTKSRKPGETVYGENILKQDGEEYRSWNPNRSKAAAAIMNDIELGINPEDNILYLGAASGTTVSHFSDITTGYIFAVEYSKTVARDLINLAENRDNIIPIVGDARKPETYEEYVKSVDVVFQDISQKDQVEILVKNCKHFCEEGTLVLLSLKAQSISTTDPAEEIFEKETEKLKEDFEILEKTTLEPFEKDHLFLKMRF